jgi:SAM-dependent methyltransferase
MLAEAAARPLTGWDISYDGRITSVAPWEFAAMVDVEARRSPDLLDMGTGGGEWLSRLPYRPPRTVATEGWPPNVPIATERLRPLGVEVVAVEGATDNVEQTGESPGGALPFLDGAFSLVINRHESYLAREVRRVLRPGGVFLTQQVASGAGDDLLRLLSSQAPPFPEPRWTLDFAVAQVENAGIVVDASGQGDDLISFADIGALAWNLANLPWIMPPDFTIAAHRDSLRRLHDQIERSGPLTVGQPLFWLRAHRP